MSNVERPLFGGLLGVSSARGSGIARRRLAQTESLFTRVPSIGARQ